MNNVKSFKLVSGEEILTRVENETETTVDFVRPLTIAQMGTGRNQVQLALIPFCASNPEATLRGIMKTSILAEVTPISPELEKGYIQQTSGIMV